MKPILLSSTLLAAVVGMALLSAPSRATLVAEEVPSYTVDAAHSWVTFKTKHMNLSWARGRFNEFSGELNFDPKQLDKSKVSFTIQAESVDTANSTRDDHLRGPDFFTVKQFPEIRFESSSIEAGDGGVFLASGKVDWMGREVPATATIEHIGEAKNREGKQVHGFHAEMTLERSKFGIEYGLPDAVGDLVFVEIDAEVVEQ